MKTEAIASADADFFHCKMIICTKIRPPKCNNLKKKTFHARENNSFVFNSS